ncbi:MAG: acetoacetyl-CoA reductase [Pseudomonadota bacterium]|nr:acetoacetyl-CoA reductase [Pseudomonadota bacterium]
MENRIAMITGGTGGIGTAICQQLCRQGANVIATYHRDGIHEEAERWQQQQREAGYHIAIEYVDVSDFDSCARLLDQIISKHGHPEILVNNAGIAQDVQFHEMSLADWQNVMSTNLDSVFHVTRHVINGMIEKGYGRIVNISSINAHKGQFGQVNYSASKAGIHGFTKALALEVARKGITVNTVSPGYIATEMVMKVDEAIRNDIIAEIPVGRLGEPHEIARAVAFLASSDSGFITGSNLNINGGHYLA